MAPLIYHLVPAEYFYSLPPDKPYLPREFAHDGFIHCTGDANLVPFVANKWLAGIAGDFLVLSIDPERLAAPLRWETGSAPPGAPSQEPVAFPHIYGLLNRGAITDIRRMRRHPDGTFEPLEKSLPLHTSEREMFLTPRPNDERVLTIAPLLRRFDETQQRLELVRSGLSASVQQPGAPPDSKIAKLMDETLTRMVELDRQIAYFLAQGTLAGYAVETGAAQTAAPDTGPLEVTAGPAAEGELAQLRSASDAALLDLEQGSYDGATSRYLTGLALASLAAGYFTARNLGVPAPAQTLAALDAQDAELAGWVRAVLTVADYAETRRLLRLIFARAYGEEGAGSGAQAAGDEDVLLPSPD